MTTWILSRYRNTVLLGLLGAGVLLALLMSGHRVGQADASTPVGVYKFCYGKELPARPTPWYCDSLDNDGLAGYVAEVAGSGQSASVCVEVRPFGKEKRCSTGPNQGAYLFPSKTELGWGWIENHGNVPTKVYGSEDFVKPPEESGGGGAPPPPPTWYNENLGGNTPSDPDISSRSAEVVDVFARGTDNSLDLKSYNPTNHWSAWERVPVGPPITSGPSSVSWGPNRIDVVARVEGGSVGHWSWESGVWNYENLGGNITADPSISARSNGVVDVFARGTDEGLYQKSYNPATQWSAWTKVPVGPTIAGGPGSTSWGPGRIDLVARVAGGSIGHWSWEEGGGWNYENLGGKTESDPEISSRQSGVVDVWARGTDNSLDHKSWDPINRWSEWEQIPGPAISSGPGAVSWGPSRIDVVALVADGSVQHWSWVY